MTGLPSALGAAVEALLAGRRQQQLTERARQLSQGYRSQRPSSEVVAGTDDAIAYALSRMPATYAAVAHVLAELGERAPAFEPRTMLDAGAGPGTASWAAADRFTGIGSATLLDANAAFLALSRELAAATRLAGATDHVAADLRRDLAVEGQFDLVACAYALTELQDDEVVAAAERLWARCAGVLVIVEPGRPRDFRRLLGVRERLVVAGARIVAPCPHERACPLPGSDWCHFSVRLDRSRQHRLMKGASLAYEDEKFSYLVAGRPEVVARPAAARVIAPPVASKHSIALRLCTGDGVEDVAIAKRDAEAFRRVRRLRWGDAAAEG